MLAGDIRRLRKGLKQGLYDMVRFVAIQQFQVEITAGFIGKSLKKLPGQPKAERARSVLVPGGFAQLPIGKRVQPPPNQVRPSAEIHYTTRQAFVHRDISFTRK